MKCRGHASGPSEELAACMVKARKIIDLKTVGITTSLRPKRTFF
jgi:hypothetical protein